MEADSEVRRSMRSVWRNKHGDTRSEEKNAREAWWEQWVTVEWPEGPLPSGFQTSLPQRSRAAEDDHTEKVGMERSGAEETNVADAVPIKPMGTVNYSESRDVIGGNAVVVPHLVVITPDVRTKADRREAIVVGLKTREKISTSVKTSSSIITAVMPRGLASREDQFVETDVASHAVPNVEHSAVAESSVTMAGTPTNPANIPADRSGASPGLQACPICNFSFPRSSSNRDINKHIDECLNGMAGLLD